MMKHLVSLGLVLTLLPFTLSAVELSDKTVDLLFEKAKLQAQIKEVGNTLTKTLEAANFEHINANADEIDLILATVDTLYDAQVLTLAIKQSLKENVTEAQALELITWFQSDLAQRHIAAMQGDKTDVAILQIEQNAEALIAKEERLELVRKLSDSVKFDQLSSNIYTSITPVILAATMKVDNPFIDIEPQQLEALKSSQEVLLERAQEQYILSTVDRFSEFSDQEVSKIVAQNTSTSAQLYYETVNTAFVNYISDTSTEVLTVLRSLFDSDGWTLDKYLALRIPEGEDLTYQDVEDFEEKQLIAWNGQEPLFFIEADVFEPVESLDKEWEPLEMALKSFASGGEILKVHNGKFTNKQGLEVQFAVYGYKNGDDSVGQVVNLIQSDKVAYMLTLTVLDIDYLQEASIRNVDIMKSMLLLR